MQLIYTAHFKKDYKKLSDTIQKKTDEKIKFWLKIYLILLWEWKRLKNIRMFWREVLTRIIDFYFK